MIRTIELTYGRRTQVNEQDYDSLIQHTWFAKREKGRWYAARSDHDGNIIYMHNEIAKPEPGWGVRHIEPYRTLDNTRENLVRYRIEIPSTDPRVPKRLYRGVAEITLADGSAKYVARIGANGEKVSLGRFTDPVEAAKAYDRANYDLNGEKALETANFRDELLEYIKGEIERNVDTEHTEETEHIRSSVQATRKSRKGNSIHRSGLAHEAQAIQSLHRE